MFIASDKIISVVIPNYIYLEHYGPVWFPGNPLARLPRANLGLFRWLNKPPSQPQQAN